MHVQLSILEGLIAMEIKMMAVLQRGNLGHGGIKWCATAGMFDIEGGPQSVPPCIQVAMDHQFIYLLTTVVAPCC